MEIMIKLDDELYNEILSRKYSKTRLEKAVANGTPLPKGHGRLVDLDNIEEQLERYGKKSVYYQLPYSPTIIESDKEGESE